MYEASVTSVSGRGHCLYKNCNFVFPDKECQLLEQGTLHETWKKRRLKCFTAPFPLLYIPHHTKILNVNNYV